MNNLTNFHPILKTIIEYKQETIKHRKNIFPLEKILSEINTKKFDHRNFYNSIKQPNKLSLIAECKRATPSRGLIRENYDLENILVEYEKNNVDAVSILTEEHFFFGDLYHLLTAKNIVSLPVLRKDFIIDIYQIYESLYFGADAILLIKKILDDTQLKEYYSLAKEIGLEVIIEVSNEDEIESVLTLNPEIVGINNRDLETFEVDIYKTVKLRKYFPENVCLISESGIGSSADIELLKSVKIDAVLVGTYFMQSKNISQAIKLLNI
jgi:indole-3-glycerol phosphate synthase